jgi:NAD(P)-dependent dehydrogenase (short-subunit alcohol dehydrogenase family)
MRLSEKTAVVIGAAGTDNMGQVIARRLSSDGATVLVAGGHKDQLKYFAEEIEGHFQFVISPLKVTWHVLV